MNEFSQTTMKPSVFISSAIEGLEDLRSILARYFRLNDYDVITYGDMPSGPRTGQPGIEEECLNGVRESDLFVLIIDRRYGEPDRIDPESGRNISMTELEFLEAKRNDERRIYIFCRTEVWTDYQFWKNNPANDFGEKYDHPNEIMTFLGKVKEAGYMVDRFVDAGMLLDNLERIKLSVSLLKKPASDVAEGDDVEVTG